MRGGSNFQDLSGRDFGRWHVMYKGTKFYPVSETITIEG